MTGIINLLLNNDTYTDADHTFGEDLNLLCGRMYNIYVSTISSCHKSWCRVTVRPVSVFPAGFGLLILLICFCSSGFWKFWRNRDVTLLQWYYHTDFIKWFPDTHSNNKNNRLKMFPSGTSEISPSLCLLYLKKENVLGGLSAFTSYTLHIYFTWRDLIGLNFAYYV